MRGSLRAVLWLGASVDRGRNSRAWRESAVSDSYELLSEVPAVRSTGREKSSCHDDEQSRGGRRPSRGPGWLPARHSPAYQKLGWFSRATELETSPRASHSAILCKQR